MEFATNSVELTEISAMLLVLLNRIHSALDAVSLLRTHKKVQP